MLQWMGGSRQKVKVSSASKQKRQKQYFEQRKRQQHQHISSYADNLVGGYNVCNQSQKENRSLDVLSLHSLSQVAEGCSSACADGARVLKVDPLPEKCPKTSNMPTFINKIATPANNVEASKISDNSNNPEQRMPDEEFRIAASNLCNSTSKEKKHKREEVNHACGDKFEDLSVFELIDEDGKSSNKSEEKNEYEAHVAFSMQGLGKVGTETPVNSPPQPSRRISSDGQSGLFEAARHQYSCRNFDNLLEDHEMNMDSMMGNVDIFSKDKYLSSDCRQSWRFGSYGSPKHVFLKDNSTEFYDEYPQVKSFDDKENFDEIQQMHADFLEVRSHFPVGSSCNKNFNVSEANNYFTDVFNINKNHEADFTEEFSVAESDHQYGRTSRFCDLDFSSRYPKHQLEEDYNLLNSDDSNYFMANKFTHVGAKQSRCSYLKADNLMDNFSSLSGESCSSSAVKGDDIITPTARKSHKRRSVFIGYPSKSQSITEDFYGQPATSMKFIPGHQRECDRPRAYTRNSCDSYPLRPVHADFSDFAFGETFGQVDDWSDKDGFPSTRIHLARHTDLGSSQHTNDRDHLSRDCKPVGENIFDLPSASDFHFDSHLSFGGCKDEPSVESATPMNLPSKKSAFGHDFSSFPENRCGKSRKGSHQDIGVCVQSSNSTEGSGKHRDKDLLTEQCTSHRNIQFNSFKEKASHEKETHAGPEGRVPGTLNPSRQTHITSKKNTDGIKGGIIQDNDTSSFVGLSDNSGSKASEKECQNNSLDLQPPQLEPGTSESEQKSIASDVEDSSIEPSYQVMMLESHMLQLLCVKRNKRSAQKEDIRRRV